MKSRLTVLLFIFFVIDGSAQDIHFSQFDFTPLNINPAQTGNFNEASRWIINYRSQWYTLDQGIKTLGLSYDAHFKNNEDLSGGIEFLYDRSGDIRYSTARILFSASYRLNWLNHQVFLGFQGGWSLRQFDWSGVTTPAQWDNFAGYFNSDLPNPEPNTGESTNFPLINTGIVYRTRLAGNMLTEIGLSAFNMNQPNDAFYSDNKLPLSLSVQGKINIPIRGKLQLEPLIIYRNQSHANYILTGVQAKIEVPENNNRIEFLKPGLLIRSGYRRNIDAVVAQLVINLYNKEIALAYDINISELQPATRLQGAFEIHFIYYGISKLINPANIPCNRQ